VIGSHVCVCLSVYQGGLTHTQEGYEQPKSELELEWNLLSMNVPVSVQFRYAVSCCRWLRCILLTTRVAPHYIILSRSWLKITVFDPTVCKTPDAPLQNELLY